MTMNEEQLLTFDARVENMEATLTINTLSQRLGFDESYLESQFESLSIDLDQ